MRILRLLLGWLLTGLILVALPACADSDALKKIVIGQCVPHQKAGKGPAPCAEVDLKAGFAVLKDQRGNTQFLLIPTAVITGIEDRHMQMPDAENYFADAWTARRFTEKQAGKPIPRDAIGLSVNSAYGRSQNQLHIHIDCIRPDVRQALKDNDAKIGDRWAPLDVDLAGHRYRAMRLDGADLERNPFKILSEGDEEAGAGMGRETLTVAGAVFADGKPGFYLLADRANFETMDRGSSESLLDHDCAVLK